ncbi:M12 family metallo-peptidase [Plesiocystis pacifica]|uniref:M12 family metallo-peptidase n=1 Tax=Plesiocystis pacifica TaxID=191768 RepID=UPI0012FCA87B|nr:M12 family metallo-peptidase [Plesiocystis pacifica]
MTFADWALDASAMLSQIRPDSGDRIHYRTFSCWVFDTQQEVQACQHGTFSPKTGPVAPGECPIVWDGPNTCPSGLEDYPYQPTETELSLSNSEFESLCGDRNVHFFDELYWRTWDDLELATQQLGELGEPAHGVIYVTTELRELCFEDALCANNVGLAVTAPDAPVKFLGFAAVTDANDIDWHTLAHETGHIMGLEHDNQAQGFMNPSGLGGVSPLLQDANFETWEDSMASKGSLPRSSGWFHTGCTGVAECAPLGKPGWSCNNLWCAEE